ncbi:pyridoxal phosphate-dependent aminotransferase [Peptostreptococcus equinus]|uniref:Aminotransferase n=1 Tax=Peptostreptococcus equinus TaxID=3003601 RepID=A0ABY7JSQ8_9FIRM|nr:pyridoxal phosphate-dependent aminotransferase [Peptostreptococcus sp. CBA3647]WAW15015.1 pyridoxal phosphate-dependent aminotransferase [Peptostreptococcus sp. CBA3647]
MLSNRLKNITPSVTVGISSKVKELKAQGNNIINLSIGEPDFNVPEKAKEYGKKSLDDNKTKYDLVSGITELREEICKKLSKENNIEYTPDQIVLSSGAKNSITNILLAITDPGDEVLLPLPYWVSYSEMVKVTNAIPREIKTKKEHDFKLTKEDLLASINENSKLLILTNPSNPTGAVYTKDELVEIAKVCIENNIYIMADEIYEKIHFDNSFISVASLSPEIKDITITVNGFAKCAAMTGIRLGYTASNTEIAKAMSSIQSHVVSHPSLTAQYIGLGVLKECQDDMDNMVETYKRRYEIITNRLDKIKGISYVKPLGAFYIFVDLSNVKKNYNYDESFSIKFCEDFLNEKRVALVPGKAFGIDEYVRISYACHEDEFLDGVNKLEDFINPYIQQ